MDEENKRFLMQQRAYKARNIQNLANKTNQKYKRQRKNRPSGCCLILVGVLGPILGLAALTVRTLM